jgi:hypothetical protein
MRQNHRPTNLWRGLQSASAPLYCNEAGQDPKCRYGPDGKRMLVLTPVESVEPPNQEHEVVFLFDAFDELRRRVPSAKCRPARL